jgi:NADPH:quinone reductase
LRAIQVTEFGGPEVLELREVPEPEVADGMVAIDVTAAGINYADTHQAENTYLAPASLPLIPGGEVAGTTPSGERVVALLAGGGYAERAVAHPSVVFPIPDGASDGEALALVLQGATAWHLLRTSAHLAEGESVVVHAGAGGVGTLAIQLARRWAAGTIIATASSEKKRALAVELGADAAIDGSPDGLKDRIQEAAGGKVDIVLEMVGGSTFDASLRALAPFGRLATFGMASREQPTPVAPGSLMVGSKAVIGFWLVDCMRELSMLRDPMAELMAMTADGRLQPVVGPTYPLADARRAHEDMRSRATVGKVTLDPKAG